MTFTCRFSTAATLEILEAARFLENQRPGYAQKFRNELNHLLEYLSENPRTGTILYKNRRRVYLRPFNYHIIYNIHLRAKKLQILMVIHHSRSPKRWQRQ